MYAQGVPLLIVYITLAVDSQNPYQPEDPTRVACGQRSPNDQLYSFPNMGIYQCFIGRKRTSREHENYPSYFETGHFLYFQMFVTLILITNVILFSLTFSRINDVFKNKKTNLKAQEKHDELKKKEVAINIEELKICLYFLFISGRESSFLLISDLKYYLF